MGKMQEAPADGFSLVSFDPDFVPLSLVTFGLWRRPWEGWAAPDIPTVGWIESEHFRPEGYSPRQPFLPFEVRDRLDDLWASKILIKFTRDQIRAAVEQGSYSRPEAVTYLTDTLVTRQRNIARHWFRHAAPLERFEITADAAGWRLCFDDLSVVYALDPGVETTYRAAAYDDSGTRIGWDGRASDGNGHICFDGVKMAASVGGYTIVGVRTFRDDDELPPVWVHLAPEGDDEPRILGLRRGSR